MPLDEPSWWYDDRPSIWPLILSPLSNLYGTLALRRLARDKPYRSRLAVVCVGNFTAGGTGKTPFAITIARLLHEMGERPAFLTRGYGGRRRGPYWIDPAHDTSADVGDEPLLLANEAPTMLARDRRAGAIAIETSGRAISAIIMDDGLQNPALAKDLSIAIIDAVRGIGNGHVIPAGPLRAPLEAQLGLVDAILVNTPPNAPATSARTTGSANGATLTKTLRRDFPGPVLTSRAVASGDIAWLEGKRVVAFSGIANPDRFFSTLEQAGAVIADRITFKDHHAFSEADAKRLLGSATAHAATLVTTEKDNARLSGHGGKRAALADAAKTIAIGLSFADRDAIRLRELLQSAVATGGYRQRYRQT